MGMYKLNSKMTLQAIQVKDLPENLQGGNGVAATDWVVSLGAETFVVPDKLFNALVVKIAPPDQVQAVRVAWKLAVLRFFKKHPKGVSLSDFNIFLGENGRDPRGVSPFFSSKRAILRKEDEWVTMTPFGEVELEYLEGLGYALDCFPHKEKAVQKEV